MNELHACFAVCCALTLASCAGEPFRAVPEQGESSPRGVSPPASHVVVANPVLGAVPKVPRAFARKGQSQIAGFDASSGRVRWTLVAGDVVLDMACDGDRLLVATAGDDLETSTVRALRRADDGLTLEGQSEPLGPGARLMPFPPYTLVLTEDMAVTWSLLDSELGPIESSKAIARPASLLASRAKGRAQLVALSATGFEAGQDADTLIRARFGSAWELELTSIPAPNRPSSRLAGAPGRDELYLVRKDPESTELEIGELSSVELAPPKAFRHLGVPGGVGAIEAVEVDVQRQVLLVLLSRQASTGALVLAPLREGVEPVLVPLSAPVEESQWFNRSLALSASGRVLVATVQGIEAFDLMGTEDAPALVAASGFEAKGLAAPVVIVEQ